MLSKKVPANQLGFYSTFEEQLSHRHPLYILSNRVNWHQFDTCFAPLYCLDNGRPAKPIRLMVALLILKHVRNLSDESVVEQWAENSYYQYFSGEKVFASGEPCEASELVHFRNRIGADGIELIFKESIRINGKDGQEDAVSSDTTVQEKNITFPTDAKLHKKIIAGCKQIAAKEGLPVRQSYTQVIKKLSYDQRFRNHPRNKGKARKADKKIKTIAGRLVREIERNLPVNSPDTSGYHTQINLFKKVLAQGKNSSPKIYSLHEPAVQCIAKGKEHKKYEFGNKVSITHTQNTGVIVGAKSFRNEYDGHILAPALEQVERLVGKAPKTATVDRGYKGNTIIGTTQILIPKPFDTKKMNAYQQKKHRKHFKRRAAIEPIIGHLKTDNRLSRNYYKGIIGDEINVLLSAAAFNFKRMLNKWKASFLAFLQNSFYLLCRLLCTQLNNLQPKMAF